MSQHLLNLNIKITYKDVQINKSKSIILNQSAREKLYNVYIKNIFVTFDGSVADFALVAYSLHTTNNLVIQNVIIDVKCSKVQDSRFIVRYKNYLGELTTQGICLVVNGTKNYYGSDFSGLYVDWKTGKIGLKSMSGKGFFQGKVTEEWLIAKGFVKKEA